MNKLSLLAVAVLAIASVPSMAATNPATGTFNVTLTVQKACNVSATDMVFGTHDFTEVPNIDNTSTITVKCTKNTAYTVALGAGTTTGNTDTARKMAGLTGGNTDTVTYALYNDSGRTANWGTAAGTVAGTGNNGNQLLTVYGRVLPGALNVTPDNYKDVVTVSVAY
ncbi:Csu type fimbrial protein [Solilutibacter silvestris]|uniref:Spore coat protein U n=1 Tax=Solilutibacter silvestris TaxID=1645665 RepID=A0A2K1Q3N0_9GAMM|nr:spore coat U domain-containing protein [Lysobacter silvestris]PNS09557.1 Spore coat protein U [Lysobacter silvestris]